MTRALVTRAPMTRALVSGALLSGALVMGPAGPWTPVAADSPTPTTQPAAQPGTQPATQPDGAAHDNDTQVLHDDYDRVLAQQADLLRTVTDLVQRRQAVEQRVSVLELQITNVSAELDRAQLSLFNAELKQDEANTTLRHAQARVDGAAADLRRQVVNSYVHGGTETEALQAVLDVNGHDRAGESLTYSQAVVRHQRQVIADFRAARAERDKQAKLTAVARLDATHKRDAVIDMKSGLERDKVSQVAAVTALTRQQFIEQLGFIELDKQKAQIVDKVVGLQHEADGITDLVKRAEAAEPPFKFPDKPLVDPVPGSAYTQAFGPQARAVAGVQGFHPGIDLAGPAGAPVRAAADGVVIHAGPLGGYGNAVMIDHGNHLATLYGHQSVLDVRAGQLVRQGDVVGQRGSTGFSTGPHLHFETRVNGIPVDPLLFIRLGAGVGPPLPPPSGAAPVASPAAPG